MWDDQQAVISLPVKILNTPLFSLTILPSLMSNITLATQIKELFKNINKVFCNYNVKFLVIITVLA